MRSPLFALAWVFVVAVAAYDVHFAWYYRECFDAWEMNPLARWGARLGGLEAVLALKAGLLLFAVAVAAYCHCRRHWLEVPYTLIVGSVHLVLSVHYLVGELG
jgi:hypothetical protein